MTTNRSKKYFGWSRAELIKRVWLAEYRVVDQSECPKI